jgi:tetratricopeptide (TPR) repeat protein
MKPWPYPKLNHPNIAAVYDFDSQDGVEFLVMELVLGETLSAKLTKGCLPEQEVLRLGAQLAEGLGAAHAKGIVHRDLKPSNLMLTEEGRLKILDFGLATLLDVTGDPNVTQSIAETTVWAGTLPYMAPERLRGERADKRTDIYAVGTVLYEMATGRRAFPEANGPKLIHNILHHLPSPPHKVNHQVTPELESKILKAMDKYPERRYQSSEELLADLVASDRTALKGGLLNSFLNVGWPNARRMAGAIVALAILIAGVEVYRWRVRSHETIHAAGTVAPPPIAGIPPFDRGKYVAVLPFSEDDQSLNSGVVTNALGAALSAKLFELKDVHVASSDDTGKMDTKATSLDIAKRLGANLVVRGSVHEVGDSLNVSVTLDDVVDSRRLWSGDFSGPSRDLLGLEDQIYPKLIDALQLRDHNELARNIVHPTEDPEAYDLYLRGCESLRTQPPAPRMAIEYFNKALLRDPKFAKAYTGLADACLRMYEENKNSVWTEKALGAAKQAQALDDKLPEVHFVLGRVYAATGQTAQSIAELKRAQELAPNSDEAYRRLGNAYLAAGQKEQAIRALEKAVELNPYYWVNQNALGSAYFYTSDYDKALNNFQQVTQLEPQNWIGFFQLGDVYLAMGRYQDSIAPLEKAIQLDPQPAAISNLGSSYLYLHRYPEAVTQFEKAVAQNPNDEVLMGNLADGYRAAGQTEKAKATYDRAIALTSKALRTNPRDATLMGDIAVYYAKKGDSKEALKYIRRARSVDPKSVDLIVQEAEVDTLTDRMHEASIAMAEAFRAGATPASFLGDLDLRALRISPEFEQVWKQFANSKK